MKSWSAWAVIVEYKDSEDSKDRAIVLTACDLSIGEFDLPIFQSLYVYYFGIYSKGIGIMWYSNSDNIYFRSFVNLNTL